MLSGKRFRMKEETIGIETFGRKRLATQVPAGSVVTVESSPKADDDLSMVDVRWDGRKLEMFADDIEKCGVQVADADASNSP